MTHYPGRQQGREILAFQQRHAEDDKGCQSYDLDGHEHGIDRGALAGTEDEQPGNCARDQNGRQVDHAMAEIDGRHEADEAPCRPAIQELGQAEPGRMLNQTHHITRPANADRRSGDRVF